MSNISRMKSNRRGPLISKMIMHEASRRGGRILIFPLTRDAPGDGTREVLSSARSSELKLFSTRRNSNPDERRGGGMWKVGGYLHLVE